MTHRTLWAALLLGAILSLVVRLWIFLACAVALVLGTTLLQCVLGTSMIGFIMP